MAKARRSKFVSAPVNIDYPDYDATEYLADLVRACLHNSHLIPEDPDPADEETPPWKHFEQLLQDDPENLVELGLLTAEELEADRPMLDSKIVEEGGMRMYEEWVDSQIRWRNQEDKEYSASVADDDVYEQDFDESGATIREALRDVRAAVASADPEQIVRVLDILFEETGKESEEDDAVEHWAEQLAEQPMAQSVPPQARTETYKAVVGAIRDLAVRLCELIALDGTALRYIEWRHLEEIVATALEGLGFSVELTRPSKDGGKDVVATCVLKGKRCVFYVEVKHWRSGKRVGCDPILDFVEINVSAGTDGGLFLSTSGYQNRIWTQLSEIERTNVRLGDSEKVVSLCQHFTRKGRGLWNAPDALPSILFNDTLGIGSLSRGG
jgi:hypothetical protein